MCNNHPGAFYLALIKSRKEELLHAEHFHDDAFAALAIELGVEDALPGAEIELAVGYGQSSFMVQEERLQVSIGVVFAGLVVPVIGARGGKLFKPFPMSSMSPFSRSFT